MIVDTRDLIGAQDVLRICGWKTRKSIVDAKALHGFPAPVAVVSRAQLWRRQDVQAWHHHYRRKR